MNHRQVVVSGIGVVSALGLDKESFWDGITAGRSAATAIDTFDASHLSTRFAAPIPMSNQDLVTRLPNRKAAKTMSRSTMFGVLAAVEAMSHSGFDPTTVDPFRVATAMGVGGLGFSELEYAQDMLKLVAGTMAANQGQFDEGIFWKKRIEFVNPLAPLKALANMPAAHIAIQFGARGGSQTVATACTSSTQALGEAYRHIKHGLADVMIAGGCDAMVTPVALTTFSGLGLLSTRNDDPQHAVRPFDRHRDGFMLGEGAVVFILEEYEACRQRGGEMYAEIVGYSSTSDAFRITDEPPEAWGSVAAMRGALNDARMNPEDIDYINAHGTGTLMNDKTETGAIKTVFGTSAKRTLVSSTKSQVGHLVAAAGCIEMAACVLALQHQVAPPTINFSEPDPECDLDYVPNEARPLPLRATLSNSFGFGGQNACLIARRPANGKLP